MSPQASTLHVVTVVVCLLKALSCLAIGTGVLRNKFGYPSALAADEGSRLLYIAVSDLYLTHTRTTVGGVCACVCVCMFVCVSSVRVRVLIASASPLLIRSTVSF